MCSADVEFVEIDVNGRAVWASNTTFKDRLRGGDGSSISQLDEQQGMPLDEGRPWLCRNISMLSIISLRSDSCLLLRLDYCNAVMVGLPRSLIGQPQSVLSCTARVVALYSRHIALVPS